MHKFLYLTQAEWADAWVNGGAIPLSLASTYKRMDRDGIFTPDENLIHESSVDLRVLSPAISFGETPNIRGFTGTGNYYNGVRLPDVHNANFYTEDGLIQSFCNVMDPAIGERFGKAACVRIYDIDRLRKHLDKRLGRRSKFGDCEYTRDHQRGHFLKSQDDAWQQEYRFFWPSREARSVVLPSGVAEVVWTK
ncbi:hypothetical protein [Pseudomonas protegens]|uniref:hypothetical protein n=1 Tax=Pseudomonas protegens TaxID=380021 RepID=UPI00098D5DEF|nr:hypothetical protein [Pseudomonas protegens]AQT10332.1 hypothetical protein H78_03667 [Pseudomonas protegens]QEN48494.1 hypothetical protein CLA18_18920 [Pseudomonas protegens]GED73317.1 hypothetical protein PFL02_01670 [Pseudomonas fluorescens]